MTLSINDSRKVITSKIPSIEGSEVQLYDNLTIGDLEKVEDSEMGLDKLVEVLKMLLISWNLTDEITVENLRKLQIEDLNFIIQNTTFYKNAQKTLADQEEALAEKKRNLQKGSTA